MVDSILPRVRPRRMKTDPGIWVRKAVREKLVMQREGVRASFVHVLASVVALGLAATALADDLNDEVRRLVARGKLGSAVVGISLYDTTTNEALASVNADTPLTPASNMKVLTSGAAALVLGSEFVFRTEVIADGDRLVVRGSGDPALADPEVLARTEPRLTAADVLRLLAEAVKQSGVTTIREIVVDDRVFDRNFTHPGWPVEQLNRSYCAQVAGLNFHANVLAVFPRPNPDGLGRAPLVALEPFAPWIRIDNRGRTVGEGQNTTWLTRDTDSNDFTLRGDVRYPAREPVEVTVNNTPDFFGALLADALLAQGITVGSANKPGPRPTAVRLAALDEDLTGGRAVAVVTTPLGEVLRRCNTDSMNMYAEALLKRMGHAVTRDAGSWDNGAAVLRMLLTEKLGPAFAASTTISDGSGMSRTNLVTPLTLTRWLDVLADDPSVSQVFIESLAAPGDGTLRRRFNNEKLFNDLRAKSGYINGVRTLSGYVTDPQSGRRVAFSVMVNNITTGEQHQAALTLHEDVVKLVDRWLETQSAREPKIGG